MNVYLICTGNTCRSPMAEAILRAREIEGIEVRSAGIHASDGVPISVHAKTLIEEADMPYTATSNAITREGVAWAEVILTMTKTHQAILREMFPNEKSKIHTLKGFLERGGNEDVQDPFGGSLPIYKETFVELSELMEDLEHQLLKG